MAQGNDDQTIATFPPGTPLSNVEKAIDKAVAGRNAFATLADQFRIALLDNSKIGYPLEVLEPEMRRHTGAACRRMIPLLHSAHRIVLDSEFTRMAADLSNRPPIDLARFLDLARLPFNTLWLEWPQPDRFSATIGVNYKQDSHIPKRVGTLIWPVRGGFDAFHVVCVSGYDETCGPSPVGMVMSFTDEIDAYSHDLRLRFDSGILKPDADFVTYNPIGYSYMGRVHMDYPDQIQLAQAINRHAWVSLAQPFGPLHRETIMWAQQAEAVAGKSARDVIDRQEKWLGLNARENNGLFRFLLCVFGLYNTGGGEFVMTEPRRQSKMMRKGFNLPAYEYRVLKLRRPTRPEIVVKKLPSTSTLGKRYHSVSGAWHHQRLQTAECARHPKMCPIAQWHKVLDDDSEKGVGSDQHECGICHRVKWWVPDHARGDKALGIVDKGFEVTATGSTGVRTEEVVQSLPPHVKIKNLKRFEALTRRTDGEQQSNEHPGSGGDPSAS